MKKLLSVSVVFLVALAILPGAAQGEMYIEAYLGGVQGANTTIGQDYTQNLTFSFSGLPGGQVIEIPVVSRGSFEVDGKLRPAFMGGLRIGAWFEKSGVLSGINFPAWMKYFGFYLDFKMHRLDFGPSIGVARLRGSGEGSGSYMNGPDLVTWQAEGGEGYDAAVTLWSQGYAPTLAFMFAARYGFYPDSVAPFGRLQPYLAVGPAILFASQAPALRFQGDGGGGIDVNYQVNGVPQPPTGGGGGDDFDVTRTLGSKSAATIALAVDAGVRWMALKNVSIDIFFNYRYAKPTLNYKFNDPFNREVAFAFKPTLHLFSGGVGAAYHF